MQIKLNQTIADFCEMLGLLGYTILRVFVVEPFLNHGDTRGTAWHGRVLFN